MGGEVSNRAIAILPFRRPSIQMKESGFTSQENETMVDGVGRNGSIAVKDSRESRRNSKPAWVACVVPWMSATVSLECRGVKSTRRRRHTAKWDETDAGGFNG